MNAKLHWTRAHTGELVTTLGALALALGLCLGAAGCDDGGDSTAPTPDGTGEPAADATGDAPSPGEPAGDPLVDVPADCAFDEGLAGTWLGAHIVDFPLKTWDQQKFQLHSMCGGGTKAVWIFLTTGWCGACEAYADDAEAFYQQYKDQGLEVLWIVGEDQDGNTPDWDYMAQYFADKNVTFTVVRDAKFAQTYAYVDTGDPALPHQYLLDGATMELVYKEGGVSQEAEAEMLKQLGVQ